jgi:hypothetical protein
MSAVISNTTQGFNGGPFWAAVAAAAIAAPGAFFHFDFKNMNSGWESAMMPKEVLLSHLLVFGVAYLFLSGNVFSRY